MKTPDTTKAVSSAAGQGPSIITRDMPARVVVHSHIEWAHLEPGDHRIKCPSCGRPGRSDKTLGITIAHDGKGVAHCFRCEYVETHHPDRTHTFSKAPQRPVKAQPEHTKHVTLSDYGHRLWSECRPLADTIGAAYLNARRCVLPPADGDLRYHPALKHGPTGYTGPALVGLITDAVTRQPLSLHRTWITADGTKPPEAEPPRMLLGGHRKAGGVIRLWPDEAVSMGLSVAEGIETALALAHAFTPAWACIDAGNLASFPALAGIEALTIAADNDEAGINAANECADRWTLAGVEVRIVMSPKPKQDLNDLVQEVAA